MEKKIVMMIMMDGAIIAEKVLFLPKKEEDWNFFEGSTSEEVDHFFY